MSREAWSLIKNNKNFNVHVYRRGLVVLIISLTLSCVLGLFLFYVYMRQPEPDYYATSGVTSPIKLLAITEPNNSPYALLPPDPPEGNEEKRIPQ